MLQDGVSDFERYPPSRGAIAAFMAFPIMTEGKLEGVLALQIYSERVFQVVTDNVGLGASGETVITRLLNERTALVMAPLRHDPNAALELKVSLNNPPFLQAVQSGLHGERGAGLKMDYRGKEVVAAWRYLPRMNWGIEVKMDADEVFAFGRRVRTFSLADSRRDPACGYSGRYFVQPACRHHPEKSEPQRTAHRSRQFAAARARGGMGRDRATRRHLQYHDRTPEREQP